MPYAIRQMPEPEATCGGIVRPARRPPGWNAPGPPPAVPHDRADVWPGPGEDLCYLAGDWRILQRIRGHRWSLDDLVTAWFAAQLTEATPPARLADLGCGIGAVLLLLAWRFPQARCAGIEAQPLSVALARRSLGWNGAEGRCEVRLGDLRDPGAFPEGAVYELVTGTPPYLPAGTATEPTRVQQAPCHIEQRGGIEAYCAAAARLMTPKARFVVCHAAPQSERAVAAARMSGLTIESRCDVIPRQGKGALFAVCSMRHAGEITCGTALPPLVVRDAHGQRTDTFRVLRQQMGMPP
jgi:tRNA1Val (adenine37-N6)-methyltransferase